MLGLAGPQEGRVEGDDHNSHRVPHANPHNGITPVHHMDMNDIHHMNGDVFHPHTTDTVSDETHHFYKLNHILSNSKS